MLWKKLAIVTAAASLGAAAPAFAGGWKHEHGWKPHRYYGHFPRHGHRVVVVRPGPAYYSYYAPRPVVVYRPAPPPVYYGPAVSASVSGDAAVGVLVGAAVGAFIGHEIATSY